MEESLGAKGIAILIPSFNSAATIGQPLASIETQGGSLRRISEIYVADDCSTDDTISTSKESWGQKSPPLLVLKGKRNLGEYGNVNHAIKIIAQRASWVLILHSDDIAKPHWLKTLIPRIEACSDSVASICSSYDCLLPNGSVISGEEKPDRPVELIKGDDRSVRGTLLRGCWWHISGCAIRIRAFQDIGELDPQLHQKGDWDWLIRCLRQGWCIEYIPRSLIFYRLHAESLSHQGLQRDQDIRVNLLIARKYRNFLSLPDWVSLHFQNGLFALRRMARSLITFNIGRIIHAPTTFASIGLSFFGCLKKTTHDG